jgi:ribosomal protein S12 methylthiotransferase accessory factor
LPIRDIVVAGPDLVELDWDAVVRGGTIVRRPGLPLEPAPERVDRGALVIGQFAVGDVRAELRSCEAVAPGAFLPVVVGCGQIALGPLAVDRSSACSRCRLVRGLATAPDLAAEVATVRGGGERVSVFRPALDLLAGALAVEVRRILDGTVPRTRNAVLSVDADEVTVSRHRLVPVPGCQTCELRASRGYPVSGEAAGASLALFDPGDRRYGPVEDLRLEHVAPWEPQVRVVAATLAREITPLGADLGRQRRVFGCALDLDTAVMSVVGEAIERLAGSDSRTQRPTAAAARRADLDRVPQWSDAERRHLGDRYARDLGAVVDWVPGRRLADDAPVFVPAQLVYCPYHPAAPDGLAWEPTTTGLAVGRDRAGPLLRGLLEAIERDALACAWSLRRPVVEMPPRIALGALWPWVRRQVLRGDLRLTVGLVPTDLGAAVAVARLTSDRGPIHTSFGSGAALSVEAATVKAVVEACLVRHTLHTRTALDPPTDPPDPCTADPRDFHEHGLVWRAADATATDWFFRGEGYPAPPASDLDELVRRVQDAGFVPLASDLTATASASGWFAVRVVVPGLQPLNPGRHKIMTNSPRLRRIVGLPPDSGPVPVNPEVHPWS